MKTVSSILQAARFNYAEMFCSDLSEEAEDVAKTAARLAITGADAHQLVEDTCDADAISLGERDAILDALS